MIAVIATILGLVLNNIFLFVKYKAMTKTPEIDSRN
jgi:hypothetical protein